LTCLALPAQVFGAWPAPLRVAASRGVVASDTVVASQAGAEILARGGNAVDAAVATALALGVASPMSSGIGGGGFALVWSAKEGAARVLDFREVAPAGASRDMFLENGKPSLLKSRWGGLAVAVPAEAAGLAELHAKHGKLPLKEVVKPAVRLAREGFPASQMLAEVSWWVLNKSPMAALVGPDDPLRAIFTPGGKPLQPGDKLTRPALARTLERFGDKGRDAFYKGETARAIVKAVAAKGGLLTQADLDAYKPIWKEPLGGRFRGLQLHAIPPPGGGVTAIEALQVLDARAPLGPVGFGSSAHYHAIAEALKHAFADRARSLGDPAFVKVPVERLIDPVYAKELAARLADDKTLKPAQYGDKDLVGAPAEAPRDHGTSHLCVMDGEGNVVALTTTVNLPFGSGVVAGESGVILNDQMDDFSAAPLQPNAFGLVGGFANAIAPGKRPSSSMNPILVVKDGKPLMCAGGSGGPRIVTATVQAIVNVVDHKMDASAAISAPRVHAQWMPDELSLDADVPADVLDGLRRRGHKVSTAGPLERAIVQTIVVREGKLEAASDPRKGGAPAAP
jgi:gamma-glutamyltranspeptidase/glutathione hydrolase